jgi:hypothetical protein
MPLLVLLTRHHSSQAALPTNQIQSNKLPNKSIKYAIILFQIKQIEKPRFDMTFDIFDTGYEVGDRIYRAGGTRLCSLPGTGSMLKAGELI